MKKSLFCLLLIVNLLPVFAQEYTIVVDRNGRGNFRNIQDALDSVRAFDPNGTVTIFIRNGVYKEKLVLQTYVCNVHIIGESRDNTIITYDDHANINKMGTFRTYTFLVRGNDITIENLTVENTAEQLGQAVALHLEGDRIIIRNCRILGNQDTIYAGRENCRQYFENCYIEGTTDFIFGPSTCWFENCQILCKKNTYITAASTPQNIAYGYILNRCDITAAKDISNVYLGRPWRPYAMTLFMNCRLPDAIYPAGWPKWGNTENEATARYLGYNNSGPGATAKQRVTWAKILTAKEAAGYTIQNVMKGYDGWNPCDSIHFAAVQNKNFFLDWAANVALSDMKRNPEGWMIDFNKVPKWDYCQGLMCTALLDLYNRTQNKSFYQYVLNFGEFMVDSAGNILTYKASENSLDRINGGKFLFTLYDKTKSPKYEKAIQAFRDQLRTHPRTSEGGFWHKAIYPNQMWLDGIYMASPFLAEYAKRFNEPAAFDDVAHQIILIAKHTYDPKTGLYFHAWDESKEQKWANKVTGQSPNFWGRSMGWYMMALVDVLDFLPENHPQRPEIIGILKNLSKTLLKYQDKKSGLWYQVTDKPGAEGNYLESSGTAMFLYAMTKGANKKYLDSSYLDFSRKTFDLFIKNATRMDSDGTCNITKACAVAGLGGNPYRDGTYTYYINEPQRDNDPKVLGPFILWCCQLADGAIAF
jgi:rhamnogalacturonyl hydrolase YesR/pectin methylesterase-like acyl-CoA thioesterase